MSTNKVSSNQRSILTVNEISKHLMTFGMHLVHHSQWRSLRQFMCCSCREISVFAYLATHHGVDDYMLDVDLMWYNTVYYATYPSVPFPKAYNSQYDSLRIRIYSQDVHAGYVKLIKEIDNRELLMNDLYEPTGEETIHGPAFLSNIKQQILVANYFLSNKLINTAILKNSFNADIDSVPTIHSPYWPVDASEWITRRRCHGVPSKSVIKQVVRYGCDFVQVSHNRLNNDGEWRFSFSKAELLIARSWTASQKIVYDTLWVLNKKMIASSNLCTYYFKTLMFWACEEKSIQFWRGE